MDDRGVRILLADDDEAIREMIRYPLEQEGFDVVVAADGVQALDILARTQVDLLILDIMMPRLDGMEVCRRIRATGARSSSTP